MTGNFNIILFYNFTNPSKKWIVWGKNLEKRGAIGYLIFYDDEKMKRIPQHSMDEFIKEHTKTVEGFNTIHDRYTFFMTQDRFRNFNIEEYFKLSRLLKYYNIIYNKKKDEFIKKKA